MTLNDLEWPEK